ncbi:MAG TPA: BTAD domain-containing putative transcriptional regulator, partial [Ilumatobacter sp.]
MEFGVLGPLRVAEDGAELPIGSRTQRLVLASLLARLDEVVSVSALVDAVWGDDPPPSALNTLRSQVSRLRRLVGDRVAAAHEGYALRPEDHDVVDAVQFERALRRMRSDAGPTSRALLAAELAAWRGEAFGELADVPTVRAAARRLDLARVDASELVAHADLLAGQWADAEAGAESILAVDPVREPAWEVLIRALGGAGRTADAMRAARRAAAALAEAGLTPGPALRAAEADVLEAPAPAEVTTHHQPARPRPPLTPTVGRSIELGRALQALDDDRLVTVVGPGGVGKTRLAVDVAVARADAHARGAILVELARVTDASGVASTIAAALDLRPTPGRELAALAGLGSVDALIVLDNCEHVVDAVVAVVPAMLADGENLRILATSREALAIDGEHVMSLGPLATGGADA